MQAAANKKITKTIVTRLNTRDVQRLRLSETRRIMDAVSTFPKNMAKKRQ